MSESNGNGIGAPVSPYSQLVMRWVELWRQGRVPTEEYRSLLAMQTGWWQRDRTMQAPNDDMVAQLENRIAIYEKVPMPEPETPRDKEAAYASAAATAAPPAPHDDDEEIFQ